MRKIVGNGKYLSYIKEHFSPLNFKEINRAV